MRRMDAKDGQPKEVFIAQPKGKPGKTHRSPGGAIIASKTERAERYEFQDEYAFTRSTLFTGRVKSRLLPTQSLGNPTGNRLCAVETVIMTVQKTRQIKKIKHH